MSPEFLRHMAQQYSELAIRARTEAARTQLRLWALEFEDLASRAERQVAAAEAPAAWPSPAPPKPAASPETGEAAPDIAEAKRRVRESENCVFRQMEIVGRLEAAGDARGVSLAIELLETLEANLRLARNDLHGRLARREED